MSEAEHFQCLMVGLPKTGKTTFLAALWHVVRSDEVPDSLRLDKLEGDQEYLNRIAAQWARCEELERTSSGGEMEVIIRLRDSVTGRIVRLTIPDMSGELYKSLWESRRCSTSFSELVKAVGGCLLFVHPGELVETVWIDEANATYAGWETNDSGTPEDGASAGTAWEAHDAPTAVQMVEILQFLVELSGKQLRLVLVISAWDLITEAMSPAQWLERHLPLLWQFLQTNTALFEVVYMGVSAQGGEVSEADKLLDHSFASRRIRLCASDKEGHDISHPIRWLMST